MPRQARLDSPGTLHHVMVRGIEKRPIVDDETDRSNFVRRLEALAEETQDAHLCVGIDEQSCSYLAL